MGVNVKQWKGAYWIFINHKGHRRAKRVGPGVSGRRAAEEAAQQMRVRLALGEFGIEPRADCPTLREYAEAWMKRNPRELKAATLAQYRCAFAHWLPDFGSTLLTRITRGQVRTFLSGKLEAGLSKNTVGGILTAVQALLSDAMEEEIIDSSPVLRRDKLLGKQLRKHRKKIDIFTPTELQSLLEAALELRPVILPIVLTMARTGMRIGEVLALKVQDIDFGRSQIRVNRTWIRPDSRSSEQFNIPKGGSSRIVDMSLQLAETLQGYVEQCQPKTWLFPVETGNPMDPYRFRADYWRKLFSRVAYRSPHTLRHTYATQLILRGESLPYIQAQLGHRSISTTVDVYGHLLGLVNPGITNALDDESLRNPYATKTPEQIRRLRGN